MALIKRVYGWGEEAAGCEMRMNIIPATRRLLRRKEIWKTIEVLSNALYSSRHLSDDEADDILDRSPIRPLPISYWTRRPGEYRHYWDRSPRE